MLEQIGLATLAIVLIVIFLLICFGIGYGFIALFELFEKWSQD